MKYNDNPYYSPENAITEYQPSSFHKYEGLRKELESIKFDWHKNSEKEFQTKIHKMIKSSRENDNLQNALRKSVIKEGDSVVFISGNYAGLSGIVTKVDFTRSDCMFGYLHEVKLSNGKKGYIEKSEHYSIAH